MKNIHNFYLSLPKKHKIIIASFSIFLLLLLVIPSEKATASRQTANESFEVGKRYQIPLPGQTSTPKVKEVINQDTSAKTAEVKQDIIVEEVVPAQAQLHWQNATVKSGDSLAKIFSRLGFTPRTTYLVSNAKGEYSKLLKKLDVGDKFKIASDEDGTLVSMVYPRSKTEILHINLVDGEYQSSQEIKTVESRQTFAHGVISSNFWNAGVNAGLNDNQIINLANIFGWDIDFALDIRAGDSFHVVYENNYVDGEYIGPGKILAAEFINQDDPFQAIRFSDDEFYTPEGKSMRKAFLRAPVNFKYISSNFTTKRFHPVQKRYKAHRGVDYAARTGTPVVAAGNGKVTHSTYNKYNGNYVFIQHGNGIVTKYLHFTKRAVKAGQRVKQGQVIGYVGATGLAAGPHLHYEFLLNGVHRNPRTVKLPDSKPIAKEFKTEFLAIAQQRLNDLNGSKNAQLAMNSAGDESAE
ncbi:peptidoglycan DD-metalloendopeptidase family protein [Thalassotalea sp. PLHSN55]|uniref:peptidoglycan DD-metalloendopeptidase family protein n=1 Tax=Thalassotalea sp. PLHSN55 TaxID=3435888 RepID=UPI003F8245B9